jgi:membrane protein
MTSQEDARRARERGRGRAAETPQDIPPRGLKDVAVRLWTQISDDHVSLVAAGVAFYSLLALAPLLTALVSIYGLIADRGDIEEHLLKLYGLLPRDAIDIMRQQLVALNKTEAPKLGLLFIASLLFSLWSANKGVTSIFEAMNIAYGEKEKRNFFVLNGTTLLFTFGFILFIVIALVAIVALPPILEFVGLDEDTHWLLSLARWPVLLISVVSANAVVYRYGPSREEARWVWLSWGSVVSAVLWVIVAAGFSFYAVNFAKFNETYGSMGAVIAVMTWIWLSAIIVIAGAELNAELEHQTARDTTIGGGLPLGARGARVADTAGPSAEKTLAHPDAADKPSDFPDTKRHADQTRTEGLRNNRSWVTDAIGRFLISAIREKIRLPSRSRRGR